MNNNEIFNKAYNKALNGGIAGSMAMGVQVCSMMWLRTTLNYQYKNGGTFTGNLKTLYSQGGVFRFYKGVFPALLQAPLSRFGDTAANIGVLTYLDYNPNTKDLPVSVKTFCGSLIAGLWRINLMPIDTMKTMNQVHGNNALYIIKDKIKIHGIRSLYHGSMGAFSTTVIGHFPWFFTFNYLSETIPKPEGKTFKKFGRFALIGFTSSFISDTISNFSRVIKVSRQTSEAGKSYTQITKDIVKEKGITELFGRGLKTKIIINGIQGLVFAVAWKSFDEYLNRN